MGLDPLRYSLIEQSVENDRSLVKYSNTAFTDDGNAEEHYWQKFLKVFWAKFDSGLHKESN